MRDLPLLVTDGIPIYWCTGGGFALAGGFALGRMLARIRLRRDRAAPRRGAGGVLECSVEQDGARTAAAAASDGEKLIAGTDRLAVDGEIDIAVGSHETFGLSADRPWLAARRRRIVRGSHVVAEGVVRTEVAADASGAGYRDSSGRRLALAPSPGKARVVVAATRTRVRLDASASIATTVIAALFYLGATWALGRVAGAYAWGYAFDHDLSTTDRAIAWGSVGAAIPFHRRWSLDAIGVQLGINRLEDPDANIPFVLRSARFERYRTGTCRETFPWLDIKHATRAKVAAADLCGEEHVSAQAHLLLGELTEASDAAARPRTSAEPLSAADRLLDVKAHLLAGNVARSAAALRVMQADAGAFYTDAAAVSDARVWLGCAADALDARSGDAGALARLERTTFERTASSTNARGLCSLLLADALEGAARLAIIDRIRADREIKIFTELDQLEVAADPARVRDPRSIWLFGVPSNILRVGIFGKPLGPTEWRALAALAKVDAPTPAQRVVRVSLAFDLVQQAYLLADDADAFRWHAMLMADIAVLDGDPSRSRRIDPGSRDRAVALGAYMAIGEGRSFEPPRVADPETARELAGVLAFMQTGSTDGLAEPTQIGGFTRHTSGSNEVFEGLVVASGGDGVALTKWFDTKVDSLTLPVALLGSTRLRSGQDAMMTWLAKSERTTFDRGPFELAIRATMKARIAERLGYADRAVVDRARAVRFREAFVRVETGLVITLLGLGR